jgi:hypothetical protein
MRYKPCEPTQSIDTILEQMMQANYGNQIQDIEMMLESPAPVERHKKTQSLLPQQSAATTLRDHYEY